MNFLEQIDLNSLIKNDVPFLLKGQLRSPETFITWEDIENCLNNPALFSFKIIKNKLNLNNYKDPHFYKTHWLPHPIVNKRDLFESVKAGNTLLIENYGFYNQEINNLLNNIENKFDVLCAAHVYCGLKKTNSFNIHSDNPPNFILQIEGNTRWKIYKQRSSNLVDVFKCNKTIADMDFLNNDVLIDTVLEPGDVLYIPARQYHCAFPDTPRISISVPCASRENLSRYDRNVYTLK